MELIHGGDWAGYQSEYGCMPLDFSQNVSPLGMPERVQRAAQAAVPAAERYPDPLCRALREALSEAYGLPMDWILCGNGAADLIWRLFGALRPKKVLLTAPGFHEYEAAAESAGSCVSFHMLSERKNFVLDESVLADINQETELLILCQPGNPTGQLTQPELMRSILSRCRECGTILAVDECFLGFISEEVRYTLIPEVKNGGLLVFRAFTKTYAMAGLRLGYCFCQDTELLEKMRRAGQPWQVSTVAQAAGIAALKETEYCDSLRTLILEERPRMADELAQIGFRVIPGQGNFLLFYTPNTGLARQMRDRGILIRDCANYRGLTPGWYRAAVRTQDENQRLIAAMKEVMQLWRNA